MNKLREALLEASKIEIINFEKESNQIPENIFDNDFERRIVKQNNLSKIIQSGGTHRRSKKALSIAIVCAILLASTVGVYAIEKLIIHWNVSKATETSENWSLWFETENPDEWDFEKVVYQPVIPEGFKIADEKLSTDDDITVFEVTYVSNENSEIYYREIPGITENYFGIKIDDANQNENIKIGEYSGEHFSNDDGSYNVILWTDGYSLFSIEGDCDYETLLKMAENLEVREILE